MMCGQAKELIAASWTGDLDPAGETKLKQHLEVCAECATEMSQLTSMWDRLADLPAPEPSHALDVRWQSTLESLISSRRQKSWRFSLSALWPERPVWQVTIAAACLALGLLAGSAISGAGKHAAAEHREIAKLREEITSTKEMVALSLLREQSASERLRGVDYSVRMPTVEPEVVSALVQAVNHDPNVNVRLAAIDALTRSSGDAQVRRSLMQSLEQQDSPMVQAALIDYLSEARERQAVGTLRQFAVRQDLNPAVRQRADVALRRLTEYR